MSRLIPHSRPTLGQDDVRAVARVVASGMHAQGAQVRSFEEKFRKFLEVPGAVATSSGTAALHLALMALDVGRGDEVILPTYVCTALLNAVLYVGARPRLADIEEGDLNISVRDVQKKITRKTKAIIVPHMFGFPADIRAIANLGIPVIEDCAQAIGASFHGKPVGRWGAIGIFSFYATKMMSTGEGGMVVSSARRILDRVRDLRDYDEKQRYRLRFNYKMTDFQAALGVTQLAKLPAFIKRRKILADCYQNHLESSDLKLPVARASAKPVFFRYVVQLDRSKDAVLKGLRQHRICCRLPVYRPLHAYLNERGFPVADSVFKRALSLPIYPSLNGKDVEWICRQLTAML